MRRQLVLAGTIGFTLGLAACSIPESMSYGTPAQAETTTAAPGPPGSNYEVWALDQADTHADGGGLLYIWSGPALRAPAGAQQAADPAAVAPEVYDLADAAIAAGCPVAKRPHMSLVNHSQPYPTHVIVANVASGDIHFFDVETRDIVGCVNVVDAGGIGTVQAHAAFATPDNSMVIVADMAGNALHKIATDYDNNQFELVETLNLRPYADQVGTESVVPICHNFTADSQHAYVTLAGGGVAVVGTGSGDGSTPMTVDHIYPADQVPGIGCGAFPLDDEDIMLTNGESGAQGGDDFLFVFDTSQRPTFPDPVTIELPGDDTHGSEICRDQDGKPWVWTFMRVSNDVNIIDLETNEVVSTLPMGRPFSPDPKPDLAWAANNKMYVSLRGPKPLTAIGSLQNPERTPGVAILDMAADCQSFEWPERNLLPMEDNPNRVTLDDGREVSASDPHGLEIVWRPAR